MSDVTTTPDGGRAAFRSTVKRAGRRIDLVSASTITPVETTYILEPYVPRGEATWLEGITKTGKTIVAIDLIARLTRGDSFPPTGAIIERGRAAILTCEDSPDRTIVPRLFAAGADLNDVLLVRCTENGEERIPSFECDAEGIERQLREAGIDFLLVDGTFGVLGVQDERSYVEAYRRMGPLIAMIRSLSIGGVFVRHVRKAEAPALHRGIGGVGFGSLARSTVSVAFDRDDDMRTRRLWAHAGSNVGEIGPTLAFSIEGRRVPGLSRSIGAVAWGEIVDDLTADDIMRERPTEDRGAINVACEFLSDLLAEGPKFSEEVRERARDAGISYATLRRAAKKIRIEHQRKGKGPWLMGLSAAVPAQFMHTCSSENGEHLRPA